MPLVQAGKTFTALDLQTTAGHIASLIRDHVQSGMDLKTQLESWTDADLIELGLAQNQIDAIKGFYIGDLPTMATQLAASAWIKQLIGLGV